MNIRIKAFCILALLVFVSTAAIGVSEKAPQDDPKAKSELYNNVELFADALSVIKTEYVDPADAKKLMHGAMKGMLESLDDFSDFMEPDEYNEMMVETKGEFGGVGIEIAIKDGMLTVIAPMAGTPSEAAGIKPGDRIVKIDSRITRGIDMNDAVSKMRGKPGTSVVLTIWREKDDTILDIPVQRDIIKIKSIKKAELLDGKIGYIKIAEFQDNTSVDFEEALKGLEARGMDSLILDLRNNPGGLLDAAVNVSEKFLARDSLIVSTKSRDPRMNTEFKSSGKPFTRSFPLIILVNEGSASGSEVVAGAMQDNKRALIVGTRTFGKASVQTVVPLRDGSAMRFTTASYLTPSGKLIRGQGVAPDVVVETSPAAKDAKKIADIFDRLEEKKLAAAKEDEKENTGPDRQLEAAVMLMKGVKAYKTVKE